MFSAHGYKKNKKPKKLNTNKKNKHKKSQQSEESEDSGFIQPKEESENESNNNEENDENTDNQAGNESDNESDNENNNTSGTVEYTEAEKTLQLNIQKFVKADNQIRKAMDKMRILRDTIKPKMENKKKYERTITKGMKKQNIKIVKIDDGNLTLNEGKSKEALKPEYILKILKKVILKKNMSDKKKVKKEYKKLVDDRQEKERFSLKRSKEKNTYKDTSSALKKNKSTVGSKNKEATENS